MWKKILAVGMFLFISLSLFCGCNHNGDFLWLHDAYEQEWINREDLKNISFNYNSKNYDGDVDYGTGFSPIDITEYTLSDKVKKSIKQVFCLKYKISKDMYDEINILSEYYGVFSGCYIVDLTTSCLVGGDPVYFEEYELDGVKFYNYHYIGVYKEN